MNRKRGTKDLAEQWKARYRADLVIMIVQAPREGYSPEQLKDLFQAITGTAPEQLKVKNSRFLELWSYGRLVNLFLKPYRYGYRWEGDHQIPTPGKLQFVEGLIKRHDEGESTESIAESLDGPDEAWTVNKVKAILNDALWERRMGFIEAAKLTISCNDGNGSRHHELCRQIESQIMEAGFDCRIGSGTEVCADVENEQTYKVIRPYTFFSRVQNDQYRAYDPWTRKTSREDAKHSDLTLYGGRIGKGRARAVSYSRTGDNTYDRHRIYEKRLDRQELRRRGITTFRDLEQQALHIVQSGFQLWQFIKAKIERFMKPYEESGACQRLTQGSKAKILRLLKKGNSLDIQAELQRIFKGHATPSKIRQKCATRLPLPKLTPAFRPNNHMAPIPTKSEISQNDQSVTVPNLSPSWAGSRASRVNNSGVVSKKEKLQSHMNVAYCEDPLQQSLLILSLSGVRLEEQVR